MKENKYLRQPSCRDEHAKEILFTIEICTTISMEVMNTTVAIEKVMRTGIVDLIATYSLENSSKPS
jgi:hypothetical protein